MAIYIPQKHIQNIKKLINNNRVIVIYGARQVGKTTLIQKYLENVKEKYLFVSGEDIFVKQYLSSQSINKLKDFIGEHSLLIVDEAQNIEKIGLNLKLIVDNIPNVRIVATGSSSFELAKDVGEPLTGRKFVLKLFPLAQMEISNIESKHETKANLESRLIYGSYPKVITMQDNNNRVLYLREIISSYLFKDILALEGIRYSDKLTRLLQLLAFQIGKEVSISELGTQLSMSKNTVDRYLDLLEKVFVIYRLSGFSRNLRKEIVKNKRYYFYDTGIRNALINNFNELNLRNDVGMLWENYIITERIKKQEYFLECVNNYFWRTHDKKEIDFVEEFGGKLFGYEIKWGKKSTKPPQDWLKTYSEASYQIIQKENYLDFITV